MRVWTVFWALAVVAVVVFSYANWDVLAATTTIHLLVADVTAPLGLTMLGAMVGLTLLFLLFLVWLETRALIGMGRDGRARQADGPAVGELRADLDRDFAALRSETSASMRSVLARLDDLERTVKQEVGRVGNAVGS